MVDAKGPAGRVPAVGDLLQVRIEKLAVGGNGIARPDGFVVFVPDAAPGDLLEVEMVKVRPQHGEARLRKVLEPGTGRRVPPCPYAGECGGCNWQHLDETTQLQQKQSLVAETLAKFLPGMAIPIEPIEPSPRSLRYRNRVQPLRHGGRLGFRRRRSHDFLPVQDCLITEEPLAALFASPPPGVDGSRIELRLSPEGGIEISEAGDDEGFAFAQVNRFQNQQLIDTVLDWTKDAHPRAVWDLYGGGGNFTFPLARAFPVPVTGVELNAVLVQRASQKASENKMPQLSFRVSDVESWVRRRVPPAGSLVVLDPPRNGAGADVMSALAASPATEILYISCHPVSLARDLQIFFEKAPANRWKLRRVKAFEMFPQTDHVETLVQLSVDSR